VTPNFFEVLGVRTVLGRGFGIADEGNGEPLLVLSHDLWRTAFGADPSVVGRPLTLVVGARPRQARTFTVIGILPPGFRFTYPEDTQAWAMMPWSTVEQFDPLEIAFHGVGRIAPGVTLAQVNARLAQFRTGLERPNDTAETRQVLRAEPVSDWVIGNTRPTLYLLGGVAALLLLITCVTVANGLLARVSERRQELARRASLGAERGRLVRQLLTEGALLSVGGVVAGSALALALQPVLRAVLPSSLPHIGEIAANGWTLVFAAGAVVISTVLAALAPALVGVRPASIAALLRISSGSSADRATVRWRQGLIATQAAIATALLISATLLLTSFWRLGHVPLGFDGEHVLTVEMRLLDERYRALAARAEFQDRLIERVRALPGVLDAGLTSAVPFRGIDFTLVPTLLGQTEEYSANGRFVDPGYFRVLRIPLVRGRLFDSTDRAGAPHVMVVSETFARKAFGESNPIGKMMDYRGPVEIVGVVGDVRYEELGREPRPAIYLPRAQHPEGLICLVVRSGGRAASLGAAIQRAIHEIDPTLPAMRLTTIDRIIDESVADRRFYTASTAVFSAIALVLTIVGIAVVVARVIAERRRELAIRSALGADTRHLIRQATRDGLAAVSTGVAVGLIAAFWGSTLLAQFLFQVGGRSPLAYGLVTLLVVTIAGVTAWLSSRRLGRLELASMLRAD
jgi:predicted permease